MLQFYCLIPFTKRIHMFVWAGKEHAGSHNSLQL